MSLTEFEQLLQRYYEGTCTEKEKEWVEKWLKNVNLNREDTWAHFTAEERKIHVDNLYDRIADTIQDITPVKTLKPRTTKWRRMWFGAAASVLLLSLGYIISQRLKTDVVKVEPNQWVVLKTEPGKRKKVTLTDGTMVWLQGGSSLSYPALFDGEKRTVKIEGEGYFEVFPNKDKPFVVQSGTLEAEVLGTSFNVKAFEQLSEKVISLVEGRLAVRAVDTAGLIKAEVVLAAGEVALFDIADNTVQKSDLPVFDSADDFKVGSLQFDNTTLDKALFQLGNAYGIDISFDPEKARKHKITATFSIGESVDVVLKSIARSTGTRFVRKGEHAVEFKL
ncbi:FecR family protein [Sphingobacterium sp. LRF_L2]|uniref:FecR family protein n=1 Tax=Sphingobacterium sp. LRF_L2 TaxID=3369421 RepID=UPI003F619183